jgi:large subunit ribosomal protein L3
MTRIFDEDGDQIPITIVEAGPCVVVQRKTQDNDGYNAVQLGFRDQKKQRVTKPQLGHFGRSGCEPKRHLREFRLDTGDELKNGETVTVSIFKDVPFVDVTGTAKGKGFQGVVRRHHMSGGKGSHGSKTGRRVGSVGQCSYPARINKGKRMPGQMGNVRVTQKGLRVVRVLEEDDRIWIRGSIPGSNGSVVEVRKAGREAGES